VNKTMKIKPIGVQLGPGVPKGTRSGEETKAGRTGHDQDRVELSGQARRLASLTRAAQQLPEIREERVAAAREAIESGTYRVDSGQLARSILEFEDGLAD
jgi:flagellar biosynthesis anti-sigma factor FlgM